MDEQRYWRSLDQLHDPDAFRVAGEFPLGVDLPPVGVPRRTFLKLLAATVSLASFAGCTEGGSQEVLPYPRQPANVTPGLAKTYATSMVLDGYATGLLVRSREGRPIKVEGNPAHPASLGAAGVYEQASVLSLYDPHRARGMRRQAAPAGWDEVYAAFGRHQRSDAGAGLCLLLELTSSPLRRRLIDAVRQRYPRARVYFSSPARSTAAAEAAQASFGRPLSPQYDFHSARSVLSVGSDFLAAGPFHLRYARDFTEARKITAADDPMNRLYQAEASPTPTGSLADHRLRARDGELVSILAAVVAELGVPIGESGSAPSRLREEQRRWVKMAADDLRAHRGRGIVLAGEHLPWQAHALAYAANSVLSNTGNTVWYTEPAVVEAGARSHRLDLLVEEIRGGNVDTLVIIEGNPAYTAPADLDFTAALGAVDTTFYLGPYDNETAVACKWRVAGRHYLESWGDSRAYDGTVSLVQPLIAPFFDSRSADEMLSVLTGSDEERAHRLLREQWEHGTGEDADRWWDQQVQRGFLENTSLPRVEARFERGVLPALAAGLGENAAEGIEVAFRPDPSVYDGRFTNNAWLLELPDPTTKLTWGNAALLSPATAARLGVQQEEVVEIRAKGRSVQLPVFVVPGHADESVTLSLGYGRRGDEEPGAGIGVDVTPLRSWGDRFLLRGAQVQAVQDGGRRARRPFACTQDHWTLHGRSIVLERSLADFRKDPDFTARQRGPVDSFYEPQRSDAADQWAMTIDLSACTGCSACVVACQAENNVPIVGEEGVRNGREMHWLRIDRYMAGSAEEPRYVHQPMLCQHCEKAPCEYVCPVNATVHSADGLNEMIYNRCVGTRFCSNNCPYKVRRFNWFDYNADRSDMEALVLNPEVTVRERGVMEKCSYCVQRIRRAEIDARIADLPLRDGDVKTACEQACPTGAIVFGSLTDPNSRVSRSRKNPRVYAVLHELGIEPRTQYLAKISNPSTASGGAPDEGEEG